MSFGRFDCDYRDVCSRVDHLIVNGYMKRDKTNRQMLIYVPDPSNPSCANVESSDTPEVSTTSINGEHIKRESSLPKDLLEETSNPEPSVKVNEDNRPSSSSTGAGMGTRVQPSRKRPGIARQPQSKLKRKPTPFTRVYANEVYDYHEAPLLGMLPTSRSLGPDEVQSQINSLLENVSMVLKNEKDNLELILDHFKWNKDMLIQQYLDDPTRIMKEVGLSGKAATLSPVRRHSMACPVCVLSTPYKELVWLWCNHACCKVSSI